MGCLTATSDGSIGQAIKRPSVTEIRVVTHYPLNPFWRVRYRRDLYRKKLVDAFYTYFLA